MKPHLFIALAAATCAAAAEAAPPSLKPGSPAAQELHPGPAAFAKGGKGQPGAQWTSLKDVLAKPLFDPKTKRALLLIDHAPGTQEFRAWGISIDQRRVVFKVQLQSQAEYQELWNQFGKESVSDLDLQGGGGRGFGRFAIVVPGPVPPGPPKHGGSKPVVAAPADAAVVAYGLQVAGAPFQGR